MEEIPIAIRSKISERLVDQGIKEASYLCCFNNIVVDFEKKKQDLVAKLQSVQGCTDQAIDRIENILPDVEHWLDKTGKLIEVESLIEKDTEKKSTCFFGCIPNCIWRYNRGKDLMTKTQDIKQLITECNEFKNYSLPSKIPGVEYHSLEHFVPLQSRNLAYNQLLGALVHGNNYVVGLQGIGGAGKTTLAIQVGKEVKEAGLFKYVTKATVSYTFNIKRIQHEIASPLGCEFEEKDEILDRAKKLWQRLTNGEKILIILDDVWEKLDFEEIGIPSSSDHNNCHVLLTTRDVKVCRSMGCSSLIELELLSEHDAWVLFQKYAELDEDSPKTPKGREIAKECKGLPVAITSIASTLKYENKEEWDLALRSLKCIDDKDEDLKKVFERLKVSYDYLKSKEAQGLFLLCSVFPEDYEISMEDLTLYAIGLGLCEEVMPFENARDHVYRAKKKLIDSCLLQKVNTKEFVKMHDLLRDMAHWMEKGKIQVIMDSRTNINALQEDVRYCFCQNLPKLLDYSKLEILIVNSKGNVPNKFFKGMEDLKVCTLSRCFYGKIPSLPKSIESLKNLRTLTIRDSSLGDISILEKLQRLQSCRLEVCSINELPIGIVQLKELKLLSLKQCNFEKNPSQVMGQIVPQLEELYFIGSVYGPVDNKDIGKFLNENVIFPLLKRYHIEFVDPMGLKNSVNDSISTALSIASTSNTTIKDLMKRAEIIHLHNQEGYKTIIPGFVEAIGDINNLIEISLKSCSEIEVLVDTIKGCSVTAFSRMVNLYLTDMNHLKALCYGPPPSHFLENLQKLKIRTCPQLNFTLIEGNLQLKRLKLLHLYSCPMLTLLFTLSVARSLVLLEKLEIYTCEALKSIITNEREEKGKEICENIHDQLRLFPELKSLEIAGCPQFEGLMSVDVTASLDSQVLDSQCSHPFDTPQCLLRQSLISRNIREMWIVSCHKLTSLFVVSVLQTMLLEELYIVSCDGLEQIILDDINHHDDKKFYEPTAMPKLRYLHVKQCNQLRYVFGQSHHEKHLSYPYHNIQIHIDFPALEYLELTELPNIVSICQNSYHPKLIALKKLQLMKCPQFTITTMSDFMGCRDVRQLDCLTRKDSRLEIRYMHTLEELSITTSKIEGIFCHEELGVFGQHVISRLKYLKLKNLSRMSYIFKGPKHMCSLENLTCLTLKACGKLKVIISTSLARSLPQLNVLIIADCESLEQIVEEDEENQNLSNLCFKQACFPELKCCAVKNCSKLKHLFCMNTHNEFPKLKELLVMEASDLEEVFGGSDHSEREQVMQNNVLSNLDQVILVKLPSLHLHVWPYKLQTVKNLLVHHCPKLSLTSTMKVEDLRWRLEIPWIYEFRLFRDEFEEYRSLLCDALRSIEHEADSERKLCPSQELGNEQLINEASLVDQQQTIEETKDNTQQCMPHNIAESSGEADESLITENAETLQAQEEGVHVLPIANSPDLIGELVEKESTKETITMDQMAFEKSIKASVEEGKIVTSTESEGSTTDILVASLSGSSSQIFVEKGLMEPPSNQNNSLRLEKPLNLAQKISLQSNKETAEHGVIDSRKSESAEYKDGETVGQSVREIANPPPAPLIPLQKQSALELVEKDSSNRAIIMDQMAFGKTKSDNMKESVQEGSVSHNAKIVTSSQTEGSTSGLLVSSLPETSPPDFVEKGSTESISKHDVVQQDGSSNEASERLEKPSDIIAQKIHSQIGTRTCPTVKKEETRRGRQGSNKLKLKTAPTKGLQTGTYLTEDTEENSLNPPDLMGDIFSLFDSVEKDNQLVDKAFTDLETYLNMPLKDIANFESNSNGLVNALKLLSSWSSENGSSLEALKAIIDSLLRNLPTLLSSFKQASATIGKFKGLEGKHKSVMEELPRRKEAANTLEKSITDAQQRKVYLREKFDRLQDELKSTENEIKEHEDHLLSLKDQREKLHVKTANFFKEIETIKKNKSEMVGDRSKAHEQLLEANYDWIAFSNQLKQKCCVSRNLF